MEDGKPRHVVVVGAGIVGASIAFRLAERGARVTVVDAAEPGQAATRASFAWINARDKDPRSYHDLNRRSLDVWPRFVRDLGCESACVWGGELRWSIRTDAADDLCRRVATLQNWGYPVRALSPEKLGQMEPEIGTGGAVVGSFSSADGHVDTSRVVASCLRDAEALGAEVKTRARVTGFEVKRGKVASVRAGSDVMACDAAVVACGADSARVAALAGVNVPLYDTYGATVVTTPIAPMFESAAVIHTPRESELPLNVRQFADGRVMIHGGTHGQSHDASLGRTDKDALRVFREAVKYFPALEKAQILEVRRALRPIPEDGHSIVGYANAVRNLYLVVTHSGVTLAPLLCELTAIELLDDVQVDLLEPYRLARFASPDPAARAR